MLKTLLGKVYHVELEKFTIQLLNEVLPCGKSIFTSLEPIPSLSQKRQRSLLSFEFFLIVLPYDRTLDRTFYICSYDFKRNMPREPTSSLIICFDEQRSGQTSSW